MTSTLSAAAGGGRKIKINTGGEWKVAQTMVKDIRNMYGEVKYEAAPIVKGNHPPWWKPSQGTYLGLNVNNSLTGDMEQFVPGTGKRVLWYTCG